MLPSWLVMMNIRGMVYWRCGQVFVSSGYWFLSKSGLHPAAVINCNSCGVTECSVHVIAASVF